MAVYRILTKKQVRQDYQAHTWVNTYTVVSAAPFSSAERMAVADTVAPLLVTFEQHFHIEAVEFYDTQTYPVLDPPQTNIFAARPVAAQGRRPVALADSSGPAVALWLGVQPRFNAWGKKDYRYAIGKEDYEATAGDYSLRPSAHAELQAILESAKHELQPLLQADPKGLSLVVSADKAEHLPESYQARYVTDVVLRGIHVAKHRRRSAGAGRRRAR